MISQWLAVAGGFRQRLQHWWVRVPSWAQNRPSVNLGRMRRRIFSSRNRIPATDFGIVSTWTCHWFSPNVWRVQKGQWWGKQADSEFSQTEMYESYHYPICSFRWPIWGEGMERNGGAAQFLHNSYRTGECTSCQNIIISKSTQVKQKQYINIKGKCYILFLILYILLYSTLHRLGFVHVVDMLYVYIYIYTHTQFNSMSIYTQKSWTI